MNGGLVMGEEQSECIRVLHVLANSSPNINGYAVRSHDMLIAQLNTGLVEPIAITSPYYPEKKSMAVFHSKDGIDYHRCAHPAYRNSNHGLIRKWIAWRGKKKIPSEVSSTAEAKQIQRPTSIPKVVVWNTKWTIIHSTRAVRRGIRILTRPIRSLFTMGGSWVAEKTYIKMLEEEIQKLIEEKKPDLIHAHTPYRVGLPAMNVARKLNIPFVYEMRGIWEDTAVINGRWRTWGLPYRRFRRMENRVLRGADHVYCISEQLKKDAISRGVDAEGITIVRNAVNDELFTGDGKDSHSELISSIIEDLKLSEETIVIGYIGSIQRLEGLETLATAVSNLEKNLDVRLLIVSTEKNQKYFREYCESAGIGDIAIIAGPVPRNIVSECYHLIDIFAVCRPPGFRVTEIVTPLKPFEAMARGLPVIVSNLPALKEIVEDKSTGLCFEAGNHIDLSRKITKLISDKELRIQLGKDGQKWIMEHRLWSKVIINSIDGYQRMLAEIASEK